MVTHSLQGLHSPCFGGLRLQFWKCTLQHSQDVINTISINTKILCAFCFFVVAACWGPVWEDRSALWGWQALRGFQTSEGRPKQLLMKDKARTSCSSFPHRVPLLSSPLVSCADISGPSWAVAPQSMVEIPGESQLYTFHKGRFCPDVFLIVVLRRNDDLWNESGARGPSVPVESTSRCLIGLNGIRRKGFAGGWEASVDLTANYSHTNMHTHRFRDLELATKVGPLILDAKLLLQ